MKNSRFLDELGLEDIFDKDDPILAEPDQR